MRRGIVWNPFGSSLFETLCFLLSSIESHDIILYLPVPLKRPGNVGNRMGTLGSYC